MNYLLQALVRAQVDYHGNTTRNFTLMVPSGPGMVNSKSGKLCEPENSSRQVSPSIIPEPQFQSLIQDKLNSVRSLSIVKDTS